MLRIVDGIFRDERRWMNISGESFVWGVLFSGGHGPTHSIEHRSLCSNSDPGQVFARTFLGLFSSSAG